MHRGIRLPSGAVVLALALGSHAAPAGAAPKRLRITAAPSLYPSFRRHVSDYVARCRRGKPLRLSVSAPRGTGVAIDGRRARGGAFKRKVKLGAGQGLRLVVHRGTRRTRHWVRCLPRGFPHWRSSRRGRQQAQWYVVTPTAALYGQPSRYVTVFDAHGVPVWWYDARGSAQDASVARGNHLLWAQPFGPESSPAVSVGRYEERRLDGTLVRTYALPGDVLTDRHEMRLLPNGNTILVAYVPRDGVDLRPYGGPADATVLDALVQEVTPRGRVAWSWNSKDHVALAETGRWWPNALTGIPWPDGRTVYDPVHVNAVEPYGADHVLISLRHADAVYDVRKSTGAILWKLGGTRTSASLDVSGSAFDPVLAGQHDVRRRPDGSITVFDNGTGLAHRPPRVLRLKVDARARTARVVEDLRDPRMPFSFCCGGARKLPRGNWVVSWGANPYVTEMTPTGRRVFSLHFDGRLFSYRAFPVLPGKLRRSALRRGMDEMHPRRRR